MLLWCTKCWNGLRSQGSIPETCPLCLQPTKWTLTPHADLPRVAYVLNENDRRFLKALRITQDGDPLLRS